MFDDVNSVTLIGNVTRDPELRYTPSGSAILNFSVATNYRYKSGEEWKDSVEYHDCILWGKRGEDLKQRMVKGTKIYVEGRLRHSSWEDKNGQKRYKTEVDVNKLSLLARFVEGAGVKVEDVEVEETINPDDLPF